MRLSLPWCALAPVLDDSVFMYGLLSCIFYVYILSKCIFEDLPYLYHVFSYCLTCMHYLLTYLSHAKNIYNEPAKQTPNFSRTTSRPMQVAYFLTPISLPTPSSTKISWHPTPHSAAQPSNSFLCAALYLPPEALPSSDLVPLSTS